MAQNAPIANIVKKKKKGTLNEGVPELPQNEETQTNSMTQSFETGSAVKTIKINQVAA